jgi:hypothetical protein
MRLTRLSKLAGLAAVAALAAVPAPASADAVVEASVGVPWRTNGDTERLPTNVMLAPGFAFGPLRAQLGLAAGLGDVQESDFELEFRPMLTFQPPVVPLYGRLILAVTNLLDGPRDVAYGGALGLRFGLLGAEVFLEGGVLPRTVDVEGPSDPFLWVVEGRAGLGFVF